jgi:hypothetical protein
LTGTALTLAAVIMIGFLQVSFYPVSAAAAAASSSSDPTETGTGTSKVKSALARWLEASVAHLHLDARGSSSSSSSSSSSTSPKILHLMDPGYADEDLDDYNAYSYEFQRLNRNVDPHEDRHGTAAGSASATTTSSSSTTTPSRSFVVDIPSTGTCVDDGTCSLPTLDGEEEEDSNEDEDKDEASDGMMAAADKDDTSSSQEASYVEHAASPGDDRHALEPGAVPKVAPTEEYSAADLEAGADFGVPQTVVSDDGVRQRIAKARTYMREHVLDGNNATYDKVRDICLNKHESCAYWAVHGECQANPAYMLVRTET